jgi:hypothetical protein
LFDIGVYTFFWPRRVAIYVLRTTPTPSRSRQGLLASKDKKTTKNRKGLSQESKDLLKTDSWLPITDWPTSTILSIWRISLNTAYFMPLGWSSGLPSADRSDLLAHCQGWTLLTVDGPRWLLSYSFNRPITLCFSSAASPYPFWPCFPKKWCQQTPR